MDLFDTAAVLVAIAAIAGSVNYRLLKLPATSGTLVVALASSFAVLGVNALFPDLQLQRVLTALLDEIDFNQALMHGMLCFLLFAGALGVDLDDILAQKGTITALATTGVLLSAAIAGLLMWGMFQLIGVDVPLAICLVFGALISPTDPIAVMGLLKELRAPRELAAQIAGESLFNDGIGVVVFLALASVAGLGGAGGEHALSPDLSGVTLFLVQQVVGGTALGLGLGYVGYRALKSIDHHPLELLITLALVMFTYTTAFWIHVSGPIAVVVAGLLIGNPGRRFAMSENTRAHIDGFWEMVDEILNAILFLRWPLPSEHAWSLSPCR
jgi:CPA1 family monovalent cation:H+ antiporter